MLLSDKHDWKAYWPIDTNELCKVIDESDEHDWNVYDPIDTNELGKVIDSSDMQFSNTEESIDVIWDGIVILVRL